MKLRKNVLTTGMSFLAASAFSLGVPYAYADSISADKQKLAQLQSEHSQIQQHMNSDQSKATTLKNAIASYTDSLNTINSNIASNKQQIADLQSQEQVLAQQLQSDQQKYTEQQNELMQIVRAEYENGKVPYLEVLFQSTSFADLLTRVQALSAVAGAQNKMVNSIKELRDSVSSKQAQVKASDLKLQSTRAQLVSLQKTQMAVKSQRQQDLAVVQKDIASGKKRQGELESQIHLTTSQIDAIKAQTAAAERKAASPVYVKQQQAALVPANTGSIVHLAESFMGTPYVWGGTTPSPGFDCSGFTQYVLGHTGVSISRTSEEQFASGMPVNQSNLQVGDLVFFSTYAPGASHVGIYIGNGMMVDAEDHGVSIDGVFNSYWGPKYIGARRYVK